MRRAQDVTRVLRWAAAGGGSLALQLLIQGALISGAGWPDRISITLAYELALVAHFFVNHRWVFAGGGSVWRKLAEYHVASLSAEALTLAAAFVVLSSPLATLLGPAAAPYAATVLGTAVAMAVTFTSNFFWIWRPQPAVPATVTAA